MYKTRQQKFTDIATWGAAPAAQTVTLNNVIKSKMVEAIYGICKFSITTDVAGYCTPEEMLIALGSLKFEGDDSNLLKFITNVDIAKLVELNTSSKRYFIVDGAFGAVGAGVTEDRFIIIPLYTCVDYGRKNPLETGQLSNLFQNSNMTFSFGAIPANLGLAGAFACTIQPMIIYTENKDLYVTPVRELIQENRTVQTEININQGRYEVLAINTVPALGANPVDYLTFENDTDKFIDNATRQELNQFNVSGATFNSIIAGTISDPAIPLFSNNTWEKESSRDLVIGPYDVFKVNLSVAALTNSKFYRVMIHAVTTPGMVDYVRRCTSRPNAMLQPVVNFDSDYVQHVLVG